MNRHFLSVSPVSSNVQRHAACRAFHPAEHQGLIFFPDRVIFELP
jgi:hypothetical protein